MDIKGNRRSGLRLSLDPDDIEVLRVNGALDGKYRRSARAILRVVRDPEARTSGVLVYGDGSLTVRLHDLSALPLEVAPTDMRVFTPAGVGIKDRVFGVSKGLTVQLAGNAAAGMSDNKPPDTLAVE